MIFLGTGTSQGVPMIGCSCGVCSSKDKRDKRLRSSALVETGDTVLVIDTGPDFRYQMLREGIKTIDAVLFTHNHKDHIGGLDDVRAFNYFQNKPLDVFAETYVQETLRKDFDYAFTEHKYPGAPEINLHTITTEPFRVGSADIIPIRGYHHKLPVLGFRIGCVCYITDMNRIDEAEIEKIKGVEILVINALRHESHISHFTVNEALAIIRKIQPGKAYLTHASHQIGLYKDIEKDFPENVFLAYDQLIVECDG